MITITLDRSPNGLIRSFTASGHAGYAPEGSDIICAAVTAIAATTIGSLQDLAKLNITYRMDDGYITCSLPDFKSMDPDRFQVAKTLMEAMAIGCRQIEHSYGQRYVRVIEKIDE